MRNVMVAAGLLVVSAMIGAGVYLTRSEPEEIPMDVASEQGARAEQARIFGGRAKATDERIGDAASGVGLNSLSGASRDQGAQSQRMDGPAGRNGRDGRSPGDPFSNSAGETGERDYEPGEVLVANPSSSFETAVTSQGYRVGDVVRLRSLGLEIMRLRTPSDVSVPDAVRRLRQQFPQTNTDANTRYELARGSGFPESYARMLIGWPRVPDNCGAGVHLGMIDAGVDPGHPALAGIDIQYRSFHQSGRQPGPATHGTAVAAMMVGRPQIGKGWGGLLPGARLTAANIFQLDDNRKVAASAHGLLEAIDWMAEQKVHVVNMSIAGSNNRVVRQVVERAREKGLVLAAAAGNWGSATRPAYPAAYSDVIAVTAIDADRHIYKFANSGQYIDFAAPGVRIWTAIPGGGQYQSGTSFASPYVSVLTGLLVARGHPAEPEAVRRTLRDRVVDLGAPGRDDVFGWGLVDMQPRCVKVARAETD